MLLGLSSVSALSLLESCGSSSASAKPVQLVWQSEFDASNAYVELVNDFNAKHKGNICVTLHIGPDVSNNIVPNILRARSSAIDIISIDIIYMAQFAQQRWLQPISEERWPLQERAKYLSEPLNACTFEGQLWAAPFRTDVGLIYYRNDIVAKPPATWEELTAIHQSHQSSKQHPLYTYAWQGAQYEGLVCNFDEVLHGYGGSLFANPYQPTDVTVDSSEALQALNTMVQWIQKDISPPDTDTYTEEVTRNLWSEGETIIMRNWPYAYKTSSDAIHNNFGIHPMLYGGKNRMGHSSFGGWQLGINAFINPIQQDAAWEFIKFMLQPASQKVGVMTASWVMNRLSIYNDPDVLQAVPFYKDLQPIIQSLIARPVAPNYPDISAAIQLYIRLALERKISASEALKTLAARLKVLTATK